MSGSIERSLVSCIEDLTEKLVARDAKLDAVAAEVQRIRRWCVAQAPLWGEPEAEALTTVAGMLEDLFAEFDA